MTKLFVVLMLLVASVWVMQAAGKAECDTTALQDPIHVYTYTFAENCQILTADGYVNLGTYHSETASGREWRRWSK